MPSYWLPLFLQLEQPPGNDEEGFTGLRGDKLVGEAEAVTVVPPEPGRFDAAEPGFAGNNHPSATGRADYVEQRFRLAAYSTLESAEIFGSGRLNRIFDTHKVMQSSKTVGVPAVLRNSARAVPMCFPSWSGHSSVRQFSGRRARCRRMRSVIEGSSGRASAVATYSTGPVGPLKNPGLRACAFCRSACRRDRGLNQAYP